MKRCKILWPVIPVLALTACAGSTGSGDPGKLRIEPPAARVVQPCAGPVAIPLKRDQGTQEAAWRRDRIALAQCRDNHALLIDWSRGVLASITGETP